MLAFFLFDFVLLRIVIVFQHLFELKSAIIGIIVCIKYSTMYESVIGAPIPYILVRYRFFPSFLVSLAIFAHLLYSKMLKRIRSKCAFSGTCK